jgi:hypothetical protein
MEPCEWLFTDFASSSRGFNLGMVPIIRLTIASMSSQQKLPGAPKLLIVSSGAIPGKPLNLSPSLFGKLDTRRIGRSDFNALDQSALKILAAARMLHEHAGGVRTA